MLEGHGRESSRPPLGMRLLARTERIADSGRRSLRRLCKSMTGEPAELLITVGWRLGDEVMTLPVYEALKRSRRDLRISARVRHPELLAGNPYVDAVNPLTIRPDLILDLKGEVPEEPRRVTLAARAGVSLDGIVPRIYLDPRERAEPPFPELGRLARPIVAFHPGATQPCKSWGRERWLAATSELERSGASVVEVGLGREPLGVGLSLAGRTSVRELARVLAYADLTLGDDSGPLHLSLAVGTPALGIFGATDPAVLFSPSALFLPLLTPAGCRFCWPRHTLAWPSGICPLARHECMEAITPAEVFAAATAALAARSVVPA